MARSTLRIATVVDRLGASTSPLSFRKRRKPRVPHLPPRAIRLKLKRILELFAVAVQYAELVLVRCWGPC